MLGENVPVDGRLRHLTVPLTWCLCKATRTAAADYRLSGICSDMRWSLLEAGAAAEDGCRGLRRFF